MRLYYWASLLVVVNDWMNGGWSDPTYIRELQPLGWEGVIGILYGTPISESLPSVTSSVFLAWREASKWINWNERLTSMTPLWYGTRLSHTAGLKGFSSWDNIRISLLGDLVDGAGLKPFSQLREEFSLHHFQYYRFLQVRHALSSYSTELDRLAEASPLDAKLLLGPLG